MALVLWTSTSAQEVKKAVGHVLAGWEGIEVRTALGPQTTFPKTDPGDVVLAMGTKALKLLQGGGYIPKGRTISSTREKPIAVGKATYLVTFDPGIRMADYGMWVQLQIDTALGCRIVKTGTHLPEVGKYRYVKDFTEMRQHLAAKIAKGERPVIAVDLETLTLDPYDPATWIVSISITPKEGYSDVIRFKGPHDQPEGPLLDQIDALLNSKNIRLRGANWKYDSVWLRQKWGLASRSFTMDTTLVGSILDENRSNSLETHAKLMTSMGGYDSDFNQKYNKARMDLVPDEPLLQYAGGDTDATFRVSQAQARLLSKDKKLKRFYQEILHPASIAFEAMERVGVLVDPSYFAKLQGELSQEIQALNQRAMSTLPRRLRLKYADNLSLTRSKILVDFLFTPKGLNLTPRMFTAKAPENPGPEWASTSADHLNMFADHPDAGPFIQMLQEHSKAKKTLSTYVVGFMSHLRADGRLHPTAVLYRGAYGDDGDESGTVTGRLAFRDPAMQTLPKHTSWAKPLRKGYPAPPGYVIVSLDYSQGELRVTACVANEPNMIRAYRANIDMHLKTGAQLNGISLEDAIAMKASNDPGTLAMIKKIRQGGKAGNFGLIYGMSAAGYQQYAYYTYGVSLTLEEAEKQRTTFLTGLYPGLTDWHAKYKAMAHKQKFVRSPLGRVRHLPLIDSNRREIMAQAERQSINSPIQSCLSDMSCWALGLFHQRYGEPVDCQAFMMTHDQLGFYVKEDRVDAWRPRIQEIMEDLPFDRIWWAPQLSFVTDCEIGYDLASMQEVA